VLVVGSDSRAGLTREERNELRTGHEDTERTDTIFLLSVRGQRAAILAFPRDLWVRRCDGSEGRINVAEQIGGPSCLVQTVRELSGIPIDHYLSVTFGGFRDIVDAVGGVELCLETPISDRDAGIDLPAGCQRLDGGDALGYVRVRKIDNDLERIRRQQTFLRALAREVASPATMLNPLKIYRLGDEVGDAITADHRLGPVGLARLGLGARGLAGGDLVAETVPSDFGEVGGAQVLLLREAEAEALFTRFRDGSVFDATEAALRRERVRLTVLNGAGVSGLAARTAELLEARGYQIADVGNAETRDHTTVLYPPGEQAAARLVAGDLPGEVATEETTDVSTVTVVLGRDAGNLS
jgi:LCP family protein required for cell wall assembly